MSTLSAPRDCPVCARFCERKVLHAQRFMDGPLGLGYDVVVCENCGAGFADGVPLQADLDRYYSQQSKYTYAHAGGSESTYDFRRFERIADHIDTLVLDRDARILDIGCATGGLLAVLKQRGYRNVLGSDPSAVCGEMARKLHGIEVRTAALNEHTTWTDRFDLVMMVGVLEHLRDVRPAVTVAARLLSPRGLLYCAQPDVESFAACVNAPYQQFSTEHVNFFSRYSLFRMMGASGLSLVQTWRWFVEWREGVTDSVLSAAFTPGFGREDYDVVTEPALAEYLKKCEVQQGEAVRRIDAWVTSQEPILIWGAGTLTRQLLATTGLARANIVAFVDSNPALAGTLLVGRSIMPPRELGQRKEAILICSKPFEMEIRQMIRSQLGLTNRVMGLFEA